MSLAHMSEITAQRCRCTLARQPPSNRTERRSLSDVRTVLDLRPLVGVTTRAPSSTQAAELFMTSILVGLNYGNNNIIVGSWKMVGFVVVY